MSVMTVGSHALPAQQSKGAHWWAAIVRYFTADSAVVTADAVNFIQDIQRNEGSKPPVPTPPAPAKTTATTPAKTTTTAKAKRKQRQKKASSGAHP